MGIKEDVYKLMHEIPCEPNIDPHVWGKTNMGINLVGKIEKKL